jgi:hypothetical protein
MQRFRFSIGLSALAAVAACGDDGPSNPGGPIDVTFKSIIIGSDTSTAKVVMDDTLEFIVKGDTTITDVPSGQHRLRIETTLDYMPMVFNQTFTAGNNELPIPRAGTCRIITQDAPFCGGGRNWLYWPGHTLVVCPANEYGEICSAIADGALLGMTWPDSQPDLYNSYIGEGKLLIGALRDSPGGGEDTLAMAFYQIGDYAPREPTRPVGTDSTRWRSVLWTDVRHIPQYLLQPRLQKNDRFGELFGLQVVITSYSPPAEPNALLIKFDITNISATDEYRFHHPEEPVGGHTLRDIYLTPMFDFDIGAPGTLNRAGLAEIIDDNVTMFPAESLLVAYDQGFSVTHFQNFADKPALVGLQAIETPPGTQTRGVFLSDTVLSGPMPLDFVPAAREDSMYAIYSAGRAGAQLLRTECVVLAQALDCAPETGNDVKGGLSIGPIPSLAPGQSTSLTIALILAPPVPGTTTPGTIVRPVNDSLTQTRTIDAIAADLKTRAAAVRALRVP